jgi:hypothetical protein
MLKEKMFVTNPGSFTGTLHSLKTSLLLAMNVFITLSNIKIYLCKINANLSLIV